MGIANDVIGALKRQPLAIVLVVINVIFLAGIIAATERKDALIADLVEHCVVRK
jgi:hypothetical protein